MATLWEGSLCTHGSRCCADSTPCTASNLHKLSDPAQHTQSIGCAGLGIKLVLVLGASQQIDLQLQKRGLEPHYKNGYRITDADTMLAVMEAAGATRTEMEANLSKVQCGIRQLATLQTPT